MDPTTTIVLALVTILVPVLTVLLNQWFGRRKDAATAGQMDADSEKTRAATRHAEADANRTDVEHRLSIIERSHDIQVASLTQGMAALERSHTAQVNGLTEGMATLERSHTVQMDSLTQQVKALKEEIVNLNGLMLGQNETIKEANETIVGLNKEVADLKQTLKDTTAALEGRISDLIKQILSLGKMPGEGETVAATAGETAVKTD